MELNHTIRALLMYFLINRATGYKERYICVLFLFGRFPAVTYYQKLVRRITVLTFPVYTCTSMQLLMGSYNEPSQLPTSL